MKIKMYMLKMYKSNLGREILEMQKALDGEFLDELVSDIYIKRINYYMGECEEIKDILRSENMDAIDEKLKSFYAYLTKAQERMDESLDRIVEEDNMRGINALDWIYGQHCYCLSILRSISENESDIKCLNQLTEIGKKILEDTK